MSDGAGAGAVRQQAARPEPVRQQAARRDSGPGRDISRMRLLLTGLLVLLVIFGVRALPAPGWHRGWRGPWHAEGTAIVIGLEIALACLLGWLLLLRRRRPDASWLATRMRAWLSALIPLVMILSAIALLRYITLPRTARLRPTARPAPAAPILRVRGHPSPLVSAGTATIIEYTVLAVVIGLIVTAALILLRRRRRTGRRERLEVSADDAAVVRHAVEAGRSALAGVSDARLAIISCYLAMERSLGAAGTARRAAETAGELLSRATGAGLLRGEPPAQLTALFYEARFSRHEVPAAARTAALGALNVILADLSEHDRTRKARRDDQAAAL